MGYGSFMSKLSEDEIVRVNDKGEPFSGFELGQARASADAETTALNWPSSNLPQFGAEAVGTN